MKIRSLLTLLFALTACPLAEAVGAAGDFTTVAFFSELNSPSCQRAIQQDTSFRRRLAYAATQPASQPVLATDDATRLIAASTRLVGIEISGKKFIMPSESETALAACTVNQKQTFSVVLRYAVTGWLGPTEYR